MTPIPNWYAVLTRAWSVRLIALAALLGAFDAFLGQVTADTLGLPEGTFAALASLVSAAALFARMIAQAGVTEKGGSDGEGA